MKLSDQIKLSNKQLTMLYTSLFVLIIGVAVDIIRTQATRFVDAHDALLAKQNEVITEAKLASAFAANVEARVNRMNIRFVDHLEENNAWKAETREWYIELRAKYEREKNL